MDGGFCCLGWDLDMRGRERRDWRRDRFVAEVVLFWTGVGVSAGGFAGELIGGVVLGAGVTAYLLGEMPLGKMLVTWVWFAG
jgi:hypothetical protein